MQNTKDKKIGILARSGAMFIAILSGIGLIACCIASIFEGVDMFAVSAVATCWSGFYFFGTLAMTGYPPKSFRWLVK